MKDDDLKALACEMELSQWIEAKGHKKIRATHKTTLEITRDTNLTERGDCIIAVEADRGLSDLPEDFKAALRTAGATIALGLEAEGQVVWVTGRGSPLLPLSHPRDMVFRRSDFICPRTAMIGSDKAANDLEREFVKILTKPVKVSAEFKVKI